MKKNKLKFAIRNAITKHYHNNGMTHTAHKMETEVFEAIDKEYNKLHKRNGKKAKR